MLFVDPDWLWLALGCVLFGAVCGAILRFLPFLAIAVLAVALLLGIVAAGHALAAALIAIVGLQIGYGLGVIARAGVRARLRRR